MENAVSESNKEMVENAGIRTAVTNAMAALELSPADETETDLTDAITAEPAESKKRPPRRDGGGVVRRHD